MSLSRIDRVRVIALAAVSTLIIASIVAAGPVPSVGLYWLENFNPTSGAGVNAPLNQLLIRTDQPSIWYKSGAANTAWTELGSPGGSGGTVTSVACGTGILCSPSPIIGAGSVTLNITPTNCPAGQAEITTAANGTSTCAAFTPGGAVAGTLNTLAMFTPDGAHLGNSPVLYDGSGTVSTVDILQVTGSRASIGGGAPMGTPPTAPSGATNGAGSLTGNYSYCTTWYDGHGETLCSAISNVTTAASNIIRVTVALPGRGASGQRLYRTLSGGSSYFLDHDFGGGDEYFSTLWDDNVADGSLGVAAPVSDTTAIYYEEMVASVKTMRTPPSVGSAPGDLTLLTGDPTGGAFGLDNYSGTTSRGKVATPFFGIKTGSVNNSLLLVHRSDIAAGQSNTQIFAVGATGLTSITPDGDLPDSTTRSLSINGRLPSVMTATRIGVTVDITGQGSSAFNQRAFEAILEDGYTGTQETDAIYGVNNSTANGNATAVRGDAVAAANLSVGVSGIATAGTHKIGVYGGFSAPTNSFSSAMIANNSATGSDIFIGESNGAIVYELTPALLKLTVIPRDSSAAPTFACGTGGTLVGGKWKGQVTPGTPVTTCTVTMGVTLVTCTVTGDVAYTGHTITGSVLTMTTPVAGQPITYDCAY